MMKEEINRALLSTGRVWGFKKADLLGIGIMLIPALISRGTFFVKKKGMPLFEKLVEVSISPTMISMLFAAAFLAALIVRYGFFRRENLAEAIVSTIRVFLDGWVIAALIQVVIGGDSNTFTVFGLQITANTFLLFALLLSWIGMKTIAGYSWIFFIIAGISNLETISAAMKTEGALFVILAAVSLFLQMEDFSSLKGFADDFRGLKSQYSDGIREDINLAVDHASNQTRKASSYIKKRRKGH